MKKLITVILILALLLPAAAALADESDIVGCWVCCYLTDGTTSSEDNGYPALTMLYLTKDHVCYYFIKTFDPFYNSFSSDYIGSWEMNDNDTITVRYGKAAMTTFSFSPDYDAATNEKTGDYYMKYHKP